MTDTYTIKSRHPTGYIEVRNDVPEDRVNDFIRLAERNLYTVISIEKNEGEKDKKYERKKTKCQAFSATTKKII